jgi:hypothetical protein
MQAVCDTLEQLLQEGILTRYASGGATAAGFHGEPLATRDVDVFVFLDPPTGSILATLDPVFRRLNELGFNQFDEEGLLIHNLPVQFVSAAPGLESEAVEQAMIVEWESHTLRVMRPEHLAAIALSVGRPKDRARLVYLAELPDFNITVFQWATALGLKL